MDRQEAQMDAVLRRLTCMAFSMRPGTTEYFAPRTPSSISTAWCQPYSYVFGTCKAELLALNSYHQLETDVLRVRGCLRMRKVRY